MDRAKEDISIGGWGDVVLVEKANTIQARKQIPARKGRKEGGGARGDVGIRQNSRLTETSLGLPVITTSPSPLFLGLMTIAVLLSLDILLTVNPPFPIM